MIMKLLLFALLLQSDPDWQIHEEIAAERMKAAAEFEKAKQFAWARAEYLKVLRLEPDHKEAKEKLAAAPRSNQGKGAGLPARREELLQSIATKAALKFRLKARALAEEKRDVEANKAWRWALLYAPGDPDARKALRMSGKGAEALDSIWGEGKWGEMLSKAGAGQNYTGPSHIEQKWGGTNLKRLTDGLVLESVGVTTDRFTELARISNATVAFMRTALGNPAGRPRANRYVMLVGEERYHRYIDDFIREKPEEKKRLKELHYQHCPKCGTKLQEEVINDVTVDICPACHGVWLDDGELAKMTEGNRGILRSVRRLFG